jgi:hypothetical protein
MWEYGLLDPLWSADSEMPANERRLRRAVLVHYPCFWRQLYGEELVATSMAALARTSPDARRLPFTMLLRLWAEATHERWATFLVSFKVYRWFFTGHGLRGDDRWRARDIVMGANRRPSGMVATLTSTILVIVFFQSPPVRWLRTWGLGTIAAIVAVFIAWEIWQRNFNQPTPRSIFSRKLALPALGFTSQGVPIKWLTTPPADQG